MRKRKSIKLWLLSGIIAPLLLMNPAIAQEAQSVATSQPVLQTTTTPISSETTSTSATTQTQTQSPIVDVANKTPVLKTPIVKDTKTSKKHAVKNSKKLNLKAVIFDPNADFKAAAEDEGRQMTTLETKEDEIHEALHGEVQSISKLPKGGILDKYLTVHPESGPFSEIRAWGMYKGYTSNIWERNDYKNTLYTVDSDYAIIEGKFRNPKWSFRTMLLYTKGKTNHDFFNDCWGDEYIMYSWSKKDQIILGNFRNAIGIEGSMSPTTLPFLNRSQIAKLYNNTRSLGIKAQGEHKYYNYAAEIVSSGRYFKDWFPGQEFILQAGIKPLAFANGKYGNLLIGGGIDAGNAEDHYTVGSAYVDYEYKRWKATFEYGSADGSNGSAGFTRNRSEGFNGTIAYQVTPKLQILGRYDQLDPNKTKGHDVRREYTAGINYFIKGQTLRLMLNYVYYTVDGGTYGSKILAGTQIIW